jgi:hypothetical protein
MNWRWAMTKTISTGIAVIDAAESWTFHSGPQLDRQGDEERAIAQSAEANRTNGYAG